MAIVYSTEALLRHLSRTCTYLGSPLHKTWQFAQESMAVSLPCQKGRASRTQGSRSDQEEHHNGPKGHSSQGVIADGHSVQHLGDAQAHEQDMRIPWYPFAQGMADCSREQGSMLGQSLPCRIGRAGRTQESRSEGPPQWIQRAQQPGRDSGWPQCKAPMQC